ncbi:class I SAM-dependent methyltransferase [Acidisoma silvae]|uniref:Methyltransferase domain-containing protein n=1 Tax=Acidisoma silvae TaxID=2802396 RepID=A0A963YQY8_9PROT|nr:methyltransferase domain-containing protein [Acidisoma silvae]MCB8875049.1 methyltransferase domain-containing protein [Acidisoma silvae]
MQVSETGEHQPHSAMDKAAVQAAYKRWASVYDNLFGAVSSSARRKTVRLVNSLPGRDVLEVGVGTGLALPLYTTQKRVTGIDLSSEMLAIARQRTAKLSLSHVAGLHEMDAEATGFPDHSFDIAAAMFVASVVPHPKRLIAEMRRLVRPGGHLLFVNHFIAQTGPRRWVEQAMAPASHALGWHPDFAMEALFTPAEKNRAIIRGCAPFGIFTLVHLPQS